MSVHVPSVFVPADVHHHDENNGNKHKNDDNDNYYNFGTGASSN